MVNHFFVEVPEKNMIALLLGRMKLKLSGSISGHMAALAAMAGGRFIPQQKEALNLAAEQARQDALK